MDSTQANQVLEVAPDVTALRVGDLVACGGLTASHAEAVAVPVNLCVKLAPNADLKQAAYNTLGAIALQGVRQADLRLGETCAVIGLGLLGQLTCLLLRAAGVRVIGIDIDQRMVETAAAHCADLALNRAADGIEGRIAEFTGGVGCDAVIITAASSSLDPVNFAGAIARQRGTVVVVGAVPTGFDREPHYYRKELQLRMSCSYGPGRYDPRYEEKGIDYPVGYVRWTEQRNMQAFQELLATGRLRLDYLTTHVFPLAEAPAAYDLLLHRTEPFIGILLEYDREAELKREAVHLKIKSQPAPAAPVIGFIGAGSYAQSHLLPNIPAEPRAVLKGVCTATGTGSRSVGERYGFAYCTAEAEEIFADAGINTIFVATRHDSHAGYVVRALESGRHVFVEKPLCLTAAELAAIADAQAAAGTHLMVGYNRRFAPLGEKLKEAVGDGPLLLHYRVNAGAIPATSWIQDPEIGGGRIIGEVCHFIDFCLFLNGSRPRTVYAAALPDHQGLNDSLTATVSFANGGVATVSYAAGGGKSLAKERVEAHARGVSAVLDDFKTLTIHRGSSKREHKLLNQDKGQRHEVRRFLEAVGQGGAPVIPPAELYATSRVTFAVLQSIRTGAAVSLEPNGNNNSGS
jgi:polar amino acid transport system substrate-binding protein